MKSVLPENASKSRYWIEVAPSHDGFRAWLFEERYQEDWRNAWRKTKEETIDAVLDSFPTYGVTVSIHDVPRKQNE